MATLGPTGTTADVSSFTNFATWAGTGTFGINTALTNFGWTRTADLNQIAWLSGSPPLPPTVAPFQGNANTTYPLTNQPGANYFTNTRGNWVSGSNYTVGDVVFDSSGSPPINTSYYVFLAITNSTTVPSGDATHFIPYHYEIWQTNDTATYTITAVSRTSGGLATFTCLNGTSGSPAVNHGAALKAGFSVVVTGLTNVPSLNGTWSIFSATTTNFTVQTGGGLIGSTGDSGTVTYTLQPICMKLEYWGNTNPYTTAPWVRVSFGTSTDGLGNLTGNVVGSTNSGTSLVASNTSQGFLAMDLVPSGTSASGAQTSSIWRCIASGSNSRFGCALFYNRNDTNAANNGGGITWIVERGKDDAGNEIDDYFTTLGVCAGQNGIFNTTLRFVLQRSILKWNPVVNTSSVTIDGANNLVIRYPSNAGYSFAPGAIVLLGGFSQAPFLNGQFVSNIGFSLTSVANATGSPPSSTVYTGTITGGAANAYAGINFKIVGFTTAANNGTFTCTASTTTTLTLSNASGVAETHAAQAAATTAIIASFTNAAYATAPDTGNLRLSTSSSTMTPIAGTGLPCMSDHNACTIRALVNGLTVNGNTPLLPVFPVPGFLGNPMTMCMALKSGDEPLHDTTATISLYGVNRIFYFPQGTTTTSPYFAFGDGLSNNSYGFALRWD